MTVAVAATPAYHYVPESGRFGDPKPFFWEGCYHVFFQNSPAADETSDALEIFAGMRWAHVVSDDLIHWERVDDALVPTPGGPDAFGCWTGCVIRAEGAFHIFYTGVGGKGGLHQTVCHATSDDLLTWKKDPRNPLIEARAPFATLPDSAWRDPQVVPGPDGGWEMLLTADLPEAPEALRGCVARLASNDLAQWRVVGREHHPNSVHRCECPDTFDLGDFHVLIYSDFGVQIRRSLHPRGPWERPDIAQIDDFRYYAAKTALDGQGRRLMFGFLFGRAAEDGIPDDSSPWEWGGAMGLPRELAPGPDRTVEVRPARELVSLRNAPLEVADAAALEIGAWEVTAEDDGAAVQGFRENAEDELSLRLMGQHPPYFELSMDLVLEPEQSAGLLLGCDPDLTRGYRVDIDRSARHAWLSRLLPHQNPSSKTLQQLALPRDLPARLPLRVYLDGNVLEVFVGHRFTFSGRLYGLDDDVNWWGFVTSSNALCAEHVRGWKLDRSHE